MPRSSARCASRARRCSSPAPSASGPAATSRWCGRPIARPRRCSCRSPRGNNPLRLWLELIASGVITGGIYALVAVGLNLQYGLMRVLNVSHGEFLMLGAYLTYWAHLVTGASPFVLLPTELAGLFPLGLVVHRPCFRRLAATTPDVDTLATKSLQVSFDPMCLVLLAAPL